MMIWLALFLVLFYFGESLVRHLGAGTVPPAFRSTATAWMDAGVDAKWIRVFLWAAIVTIAGAIFIPLLYVIFDVSRDIAIR